MGLSEFAGTPRFAIRRRLGVGGMGVVYEAFDRQRGTRVAIKTIPRLDAASLYRFKQEFRLLADVVHENLVRLHELVCEGDQWFFSMDLVSGVDLLSYCWGRTAENDGYGRAPRLPSAPPPGESAPPSRYESGFVPARAADDTTRLRSALRQLVCAVSALHDAGKLHRDIKPGNILVEPNGRLVLLDFGLGTDLTHAARGPSETERILGTPAYMAPEQASPQGVNESADWYAVGVVLFEALTGRLPFEGGAMEVLLAKQSHLPPRPSDLTEGVPADLDALCMALLSPHPGDRPTGPELLRRVGANGAAYLASGAMGLRSSAVPPPLVGRDAMLATLRMALDTVRHGRPALVHVVGASGMGKTALVRHFLAEVERDEPAVVLSGRCYEHESLPYKGFDAVIDGLSRALSGLSAREAEQVAPRDARALARVFPVLDRVRAIASAPQRSVAEADPQKLRARAFGALRELLARLSDRRLVVLHIDDLQWGDADSAALLYELTSSVDPPPVLVLVSYRSEDVANQPWLDGLSRSIPPPSATRAPGQGPLTCTVDVGELAPSDALALAASLLHTHGEDPVARQIAAESAGSPFFLCELARHALSEGSAERGLTLERVLEGRVAALPPTAHLVLELSAIAGRPLSRDVTLEVLGLPAEELDTAFATLTAARLVRRAGGDEERVEPYHDRIRETVLGLVPEARRRSHHERMARVLEARGDKDPDELYAHYEAAGCRREAAVHAEAAAERATALLAFDRAADLYRRALALAQDEPGAAERIEERVADSLARAGRGAAAADAYMAAAQHRSGSARLDLQRKASEQLLFSGHIDRGVGLVQAVLSQVGMRLARSPFTALLGLLFVRAWLALRGTRFTLRRETAIEPAQLARIDACAVVANGLSFVDNIQGKLFQGRAFVYALQAGEPARIVHALAGESIFRAVDGHRSLPRALALLDRAEQLVVEGEVEHHGGTLAYGRGMVYHITGHWPEARSCFERAEELFEGARASHYRVELDGAQSYGITVLVLLGELAEASRRHAALLREAEDRGDLFLGTNLSIGVPSQCWLFADQPAAARRLAADAMARWSPAGFHLQHWHELVALTSIDLYEGEPERALERIRVRWAPFRGSMLMRIEYIRLFALHLRAACHVAVAARSAGPSRAGMLRAAERDARALEQSGAPYAQGLAGLVRGGVASVQGDVTTAAERFERASATLDGAHLALYATVARRRVAELRAGADGSSQLVRADGWMIAQGVRRPERIANMLAPGRFPDTRPRRR